MKNIPKKIYLQIDPYENGFDDFAEAAQDGITWDVKKIHDSDIAFIQDSIEEVYKKLDELSELLALLEQIDKRIISIDKEAVKSSSNERGLFLEGKSSGLNEAYRMIKQKFSIK